jgi:cysteinyl-tRNA synthetase
MFKRFIKWIFGIQDKDEEESTENNNTTDVQKEQHSQIFKLKTEVIKLRKEAIASRKRNETNEQTMRNLNSRLEILEEEDQSDFQTADEIKDQFLKNDEKVEKDKPKKPKKKKGLRDKLLDNNDK